MDLDDLHTFRAVVREGGTPRLALKELLREARVSMRLAQATAMAP